MFTVIWDNGRQTKVCSSEDEVWSAIGSHWGYWEVKNADGTAAKQFYPF